MNTDLCEKVDVSRIVIQRVDGLASKARVSSIEAANNVLESWADSTPEAENDQCDFQIVFEDGFRYQGHLRLNKCQKRISLSRHVRKQLTALAKTSGSRRSTRASKEEAAPVITMIGEDVAESAKIALEHYNI